MATVEEYGSGRILHLIIWARRLLPFVRFPVVGPFIASRLEERMKPFAIRVVIFDEISRVLEESDHVAAGLRVCQPLFPNHPVTEAIFFWGLLQSVW